jgi:hypothetical protein
VFISYSTKDKRFADAICSWLERNNMKCWYAPRDITPGIQYGEAIINAINDCKVMVIVFTENANISKYVCKEVERAVSKGAVVVPVRFQDIMPSKSLEFFLSSNHWLDAIDPPLERHFDQLAATIRALIDAEKIQVPYTQSTTTDQEDIQLFNQLDLSDLDSPKQKWMRRLYQMFQDKS